MAPTNLQSLLAVAATHQPANGLIIYPPDNREAPVTLSYKELYAKARSYSVLLRLLQGNTRQKPVVLYLDGQLSTLIWFWAVLFADSVPVILPPMSQIEHQRNSLISSLDTTLEHPIWLIATSHRALFERVSLNVLSPEMIENWHKGAIHLSEDFWCRQNYGDLAMLMLTSGSTSDPKAVRLSHQRILSSVKGKLSMRALPTGKPFLNWIGLDHVASIIEIHLTAIREGVDQIHIPAADLIVDPMLFIKLLSRHQVARTFAPNFFLAKIADEVQHQSENPQGMELDFSSLTWLGSGGEANDVEVCSKVSKFVSAHNGRPDAIVPGFGMTETCAGSVYHLDCPVFDTRRGFRFTSLGKCIQGMEIRIRSSSNDDGTTESNAEAPGELEVRGEMVFDGYYNNKKATDEAFTPDGWFKTGDRAFIDCHGSLNMTGRSKETINVNGVKHLPQNLEALLSQILPRNVTRVVSFAYRTADSQTESICVLYVFTPEGTSDKDLIDMHEKVVQTIMLQTGTRPLVITLPDETLLQVTSLGKVSRTKMRTALYNGSFQPRIDAVQLIIEEHHQEMLSSTADEMEEHLLADLRMVLNLPPDLIGIHTPIFDVGVTSVDLIRFVRQIQTRTGIKITIATLLLNPTIRSLVAALKDIQSSQKYDPVVTLKSKGERTPLWLIHPGVGEVLVFLGLAKHIDNRPVYALRARGFDNEPYFGSITEVVTTYIDVIKKQQPSGPYAIAGYSFGAMLAFEICKGLESNGKDEVRFFGNFNLPPHIKHRMRQLDWHQCLLHLCYFLDLISEDAADKITPDISHLPQDQALNHMLGIVDQKRLQELSIDLEGLKNWASLAYNLQRIAVDYEPTGTVSSVDIFHAEPLKAVASSRQEWVEQSLSKWEDFSRTKPQLHEVGGAHYTMLNQDHVSTFANTLTQALAARGL